MKDNITLADYMRHLRLNKGYTQSDIAEMLGIHRSTYTYYESGKTEPNLDILKRLAKIYKMPISELITVNKSRSEILADTKIFSRTQISKTVLTNVETELIEQFRHLTPGERRAFLNEIKEYNIKEGYVTVTEDK